MDIARFNIRRDAAPRGPRGLNAEVQFNDDAFRKEHPGFDGMEQISLRTDGGREFPLGYHRTEDGYDSHAAYVAPYGDRGAIGGGGGWTRDYYNLDSVEVVAKTNVGEFVLGKVKPRYR